MVSPSAAHSNARSGTDSAGIQPRALAAAPATPASSQPGSARRDMIRCSQPRCREGGSPGSLRIRNSNPPSDDRIARKVTVVTARVRLP